MNRQEWSSSIVAVKKLYFMTLVYVLLVQGLGIASRGVFLMLWPDIIQLDRITSDVVRGMTVVGYKIYLGTFTTNTVAMKSIFVNLY